MGRYEALGDIDAIRKRPHHIIGSVENPNHLLTEVIDNSLDEMANGHANLFSLDISENGSITVMDNGRGFEVYDNFKLPDGSLTNSVVGLCTKLYTGGKFNNKDYANLIGMHGIGLVAVNALSDNLEIITRNRINRTTYHKILFENAIPVKQEIISVDDPWWNTKITFNPSSRVFDSTKLDISEIAKRLTLCQSHLQNCKFIINGKIIPKMTLDKYAKLILSSNGELINYNHQISDDFTIKTNSKIYNFKNSKINVFIGYDHATNISTSGDVNLRICDGTYLTTFQTKLKNCINAQITNKFKDTDPNLYLLGLRLYISLVVPLPEFNSQEKRHMTLRVDKPLIDPIFENLKLPKEMLKTIEHNIINRAFKKSIPTTRKKILSKENPTVDATVIPGKILYIVEGDSAFTSVKKVSIKRNEGIFPIGGKIRNILTSSPDSILKDNTISHLNETLGPLKSRRYEAVALFMDADPDGAHIATLMTSLFTKIGDDYIKNGNFYWMIPPLFGAFEKKGTDYKLFYTIQEFEQYKDKYLLQRFKGLGEMNPKIIREILDKNVRYKVIWPNNYKELETLNKIVTDTDIKRHVLNNKNVGFHQVIKKVINGGK